MALAGFGGCRPIVCGGVGCRCCGTRTRSGRRATLLDCKYRGGLRYQISAALEEFYTFAAACKVPEIHTLATTVDTWQQPIIAAIDTRLSNARSEGYNRIVKHIQSQKS